MTASTKLKFATIGMLACGFTLAIWWRYQTIKRLEIQRDRLIQQAMTREAELTKLERLRAEQPRSEELNALREAAKEAARAREQLAHLEAPPEVLRDRAAKAAPEPVEPPRKRAWANRGATTPQTAVETLIWAAVQADVTALEKLIWLDPANRAQAEALFAGSDEKTRAEYGTAGELFATLLAAKFPMDLSDFDLVEASERSDGATLRLALKAPGPGGMERVKSITLNLRRGPEGWRIVVPTRVAEQALRMVKGR